MTWDQLLSELQTLRHRILNVHIRPVGWERDVFHLRDRVHTVKSLGAPRNRIALLFEDAEAGLYLDPHEFVMASWDRSWTEADVDFRMLIVRIGEVDIGLEPENPTVGEELK